MFAKASHDLLQRQHSMAEHREQINRCISAFRFIMLCSRNSAAQASLYMHAETMLSRLELPLLSQSGLGQPTNTRTFFVPILDINRYIGIVKDQVDVVQNVDDIVTSTQLIRTGNTESRNNAAALMEQLGKTGLGFISNEDNEKFAIEAIDDAERKRDQLEVVCSYQYFVGTS